MGGSSEREQAGGGVGILRTYVAATTAAAVRLLLNNQNRVRHRVCVIPITDGVGVWHASTCGSLHDPLALVHLEVGHVGEVREGSSIERLRASANSDDRGDRHDSGLDGGGLDNFGLSGCHGVLLEGGVLARWGRWLGRFGWGPCLGVGCRIRACGPRSEGAHRGEVALLFILPEYKIVFSNPIFRQR